MKKTPRISFPELEFINTREERSPYFEFIINNSNDAIFSMDIHGIVKSWNPTAEKIYGYTRKEMIDKSIQKISSHEHDDLKQILKKVTMGKSVHNYETISRRRGGR